MNRRARRILEGSWALWWLKTPQPGVVQLSTHDRLPRVSVEDRTAADREGARESPASAEYVREHYPGLCASMSR